MFSALRKQVNPAMVLALVALVFAVTGGAYAASGNGGSGQGSAHATLTANAAKAKAAPKGKAGPRGPAGAKGAAGAAGPAGATGPVGPAGPAGGAGPQGPAGNSGTNGTSGEPGKNGESVTVGTPSKAECAEGGSKFSNATGTGHACNGKTGFTKTLPPKETETGTWGINSGAQKSGGLIVMLASFPIPLSESLPHGHAHFINSKDEEVTENGSSATHPACTGTVEAPAATPGNLCVYAAEELEHLILWSEFIQEPFKGSEEASVGKTGVILVSFPEAENAKGFGTWAVTENE